MKKFYLLIYILIIALSQFFLVKTNYAQISELKILPSDGTAEAIFGISLSTFGDYAIIGAPGGVGVGSAYVFKREGGNWIQQQKLQASDGFVGNLFGEGISISGDYVILGARQDDDNGYRSGSAYIFHRVGDTWIQEAKLLPNDGASMDFFGYSVALSGDYAIIGSYNDDDNGNNSGSAYVFHRAGNNWIQEAKLLPNDGAAEDWFGWGVTISGDFAIVGSFNDDDNGENSGAAYIFQRVGNSWIQKDKLLASDGAAGDWFGRSVSLSGDYTIVGSRWDDDNGNNSGSAYIFQRIGDNWVEQEKLLADDGAADDWFGFNVSISEDIAVVGSIDDDNINGTDAGSAYIFQKDDNNWNQVAKLTSIGGESYDWYGAFTSIYENTLLIGAYGNDDNGNMSGSAYIHDNFLTNDGLVAYYPFNGNANDESGNGNDGMVDGATLTYDRFNNANSAYTFDGIDDEIVFNFGPIKSQTVGTINLWVKFYDENKQYNIFSDENYLFRSQLGGGPVNGPPQTTFYFIVNGESSFWVPENTGYDFTNWHMYTFVWDNNSKKIYFDGNLLGEKSGGFISPPSSNLIISPNSLARLERLHGVVDDIRLFNLSLTQDDIIDLFSEEGVLSAYIEGKIEVDNSVLPEVLVKLLDEDGNPIEGIDDVHTDNNGFYSFTDLAPQYYQVMIVEPLGYSVDENPKLVHLQAGDSAELNFELTEQLVNNQSRSAAYWMFQFIINIRGWGFAQESESDLYSYMNVIQEHYTPHFDFFQDYSTLQDWKQLLKPKFFASQHKKALRQLAALVLNFASMKIGQYTVVTEDNKTAGDVLTYVSLLLTDEDNTNDRLAKVLAFKVNLHLPIGASIIPDGDILYKGFKQNIDWRIELPKEYTLYQNYPNPFNPSTKIFYQLPQNSNVTVNVYDILGNRIKTLVNEFKVAGKYEIEFYGSKLASGVYIYQIRANNYTANKKMILMK